MTSRRARFERGQSLVEFSLVAVQLCVVLFAIVEFGRMVLVATTVAHAARTGVRYAIVHGATRTGTGVDGPSGPGSTAEIEANVRRYAGTGLMITSRLVLTISYPDGNNNPGSRVRVRVVYPYDPFTLLPLNFNLGTTTEGVICF
jgi:Flp pilus assembly protein TadG